MKRSILLPADAIINLILGIILLLDPLGIAERIGIPLVEISFYPIILGAVLAGIGIALLLEWSGRFPGLQDQIEHSRLYMMNARGASGGLCAN